MSKRILGDLRIFQAVHNDLKLLHQSENHAYVYPGVDPYELEDSAFPTVVGEVEKLLATARQDERVKFAAEMERWTHETPELTLFSLITDGKPDRKETLRLYQLVMANVRVAIDRLTPRKEDVT